MIMYLAIPSLKLADCDFGQEDEFSVGHHESLDGFLKNKDSCLIILPKIFKLIVENGNTLSKQENDSFERKVVLVKAIVLPVDYKFE